MKRAHHSKWQFMLLFIFIIAILTYPATGCKPPASTSPQPVPSIPQNPTISLNSTGYLVPFLNTNWEYTVYFPKDWYVQNNMNSSDKGILDFHAPEPYHAMLSVEVNDVEKMEIEADIELVAQQRIDNAEFLWGEISLLENYRLNNFWDWYYSFEGVLWDLDFHVGTYLKQTDKFLYMLKIQLVRDEYDDTYLSTLEQIPEAFKLNSG